ncbi:MAG: hypothetical protein AAB373_00430 [Patescibacteria group bacterium]
MQEGKDNDNTGNTDAVGVNPGVNDAVSSNNRGVYGLSEMDQRVRVVDAKTMLGADKVGEISPAELEEFRSGHGDQLYLMNKALEKLKARKVVVESAHIYGYENPGMEHYLQMRVAAMLVKILREGGREVVNTLFIDDLHSHGSIGFDVPTYIREAALRGWDIDELYYESDMRELAGHIVTTLEALGKVVDKDNKRVLDRGKVDLIKPNLRKDPEPSCALLDAAFTSLKLRKHGAQAIVNILPEGHGYKQQQHNTRTILRAALGQEDLPFLNLFVNLERNGKPKHKIGRSHRQG